MGKRNKKREHKSLPTAGLMILLISLVILLFMISYYDYCCGYEWWSSVLVGVSGSLITGLLIYALTNYRATKYQIAQHEYTQINALYNCIVNYRRRVSFFKKHHVAVEDCSVDVFIEDIANSIDAIDELIERVPERVFFNELKYETSYPITSQMEESIRKAYSNISDDSDWKHIEILCALLINSYDLLLDWIKPTYQNLCQVFDLYQTRYY